MSYGINEVTLVGNLGTDPKEITTKNNKKMAAFRMATNTYAGKDENGESKVDTNWHNIVAFGKKAEACLKTLKVGRSVIVKGKLQNRTWEDSKGEKHYATDIIVTDFIPQGPAPKTSSSEE